MTRTIILLTTLLALSACKTSNGHFAGGYAKGLSQGRALNAGYYVPPADPLYSMPQRFTLTRPSGATETCFKGLTGYRCY